MQRMRIGRTIAVLVLGLALSGCSNGLHRLEGQVLVDGKPAMEGVQVFLYAQGNHQGAIASCGPEGKFSVNTNGRTGLMTGTYKVVLINSFESLKAGSFTPEELEAAQREGRPPKGWGEYQAKIEGFLNKPPTGPGWIPKAYADRETSPLTIEVPPKKRPVTIDVPSAEPAAPAKR
jgi:hypothetical protein